MSKVVRWCFTVNNPGAWRPAFNATHMDYMCYEIEHAPTTGTEHLQGYVRFKTRKAIATVKGLIYKEAHLEAAKGNEEQNRTYCNKEGGIVEQGVYDGTQGSKQGKRNDLTEALDKLKAGVPKAKVFQEHMNLIVKYPTGMEKAAEVAMGEPAPKRAVHNTVLWGKTGTGKTHRCMMSFPDAYCAVAREKGTWDFYSGQDVVILDEFDPLLMSNLSVLLKWLDEWKTQLECRYVNRWARWTRMYITCQTDPRTWYTGNIQEHRQALVRRLSEPMGRIVEVVSREQEIDLNWWVVEPAREPARPLDTPAAAGSSMQPAAEEVRPLKRRRTEDPDSHGETTKSSSETKNTTTGSSSGSSQHEVVCISDSEEESQSQ